MCFLNDFSPNTKHLSRSLFFPYWSTYHTTLPTTKAISMHCKMTSIAKGKGKHDTYISPLTSYHLISQYEQALWGSTNTSV